MEEKLDKLIQMQENMHANITTLKSDVSIIKDAVAKHTQILNMHTRILDEHTKKLDEHTRILDEHTKKLDEHTKILDEHDKKLDTVSNIVCLIEEEHGKKLQVLLERDVDYVRKQESCKSYFSEIYHTLEKYDARIYNLENPA